MKTAHGDREKFTLSFDFDNHKLTLLEIDGQLYFIAKEVGAILGYTEEGSRLSTFITREWAEELKEGQHWRLLTGEPLQALKEILRITQDQNSAKTRRLLLLTEPGLWRVLILTGKPAGIRLRDKLDSEILPQLRKTGQVALLGTPPALPARRTRFTPTPLLPPPLQPIETLLLRFYRRKVIDTATLEALLQRLEESGAQWPASLQKPASTLPVRGMPQEQAKDGLPLLPPPPAGRSGRTPEEVRFLEANMQLTVQILACVMPDVTPQIEACAQVLKDAALQLYRVRKGAP